MEKSPSHHLQRGKTCLGRNFYLPETNRKNWARSAASHLSSDVKWILERRQCDNKMLDTAIEALQRNFNNPVHYGDNKPGWTFGKRNWMFPSEPGDPPEGIPVVPDPRFTYHDLYGFGISGEDYYKGFLRDCGLPESMPHFIIVGASSLLLIDDAVDALDHDDPWYATWALYQAHELFTDLLSGESNREALREFRSLGGKAAHRETDQFKAGVLDEWKGGRHKSISACAKWAINQYPVNYDVVKRWIRAYKKAGDSAC